MNGRWGPMCNLLTHSEGLTKILRVSYGIFQRHEKGVPPDFVPQLHKNDGEYFEISVTWGIHSSCNENYSLVGHDVVQFGRLTLILPKNNPPPILRPKDGGRMIFESLLPTYQTARRHNSTDGHFTCNQISCWEHNKHVATFEDSVTAEVNDDHFRSVPLPVWLGSPGQKYLPVAERCLLPTNHKSEKSVTLCNTQMSRLIRCHISNLIEITQRNKKHAELLRGKQAVLCTAHKNCFLWNISKPINHAFLMLHLGKT